MSKAIVDAARIANKLNAHSFKLPAGHLFKKHSPHAIYTKALADVVLDELKLRYSNPAFRLEMYNEVIDLCVWGASYIDEANQIAKFSIAKGQNSCWARFSRIKELMHIYTGFANEGSGRTIMHAARQALLVHPDDIHKDFDAETFCIFLAIEIMLPFSERETLIKMKDDQGLTDYEIALACKTPQLIIQDFFATSGTDYPCYCETSLRAHKEISNS